MDTHAPNIVEGLRFQTVIAEICHWNWHGLTPDQMVAATWAYYYFSVQFRESLEIARRLVPADEKLAQLEAEECNTANLSPWPGVAAPGEAMNHDEFMRRTLALMPIEAEKARFLDARGQAYLAATRQLDDAARAASIASYEDGGLERVFSAMLTFARWDNDLLVAFRHFLSQHVMFDSDPEQGHGALSRHLVVDDRILPLWEGFRNLLLECVPGLVD